jgi:hypothetical protein
MAPRAKTRLWPSYGLGSGYNRPSQLSKEVFVLDAGPAAAGASFGALESSFPLQDALLPGVIIAVLETSNRPWAGQWKASLSKWGWATRLRRFRRWGTASWSFCCFRLHSWLAPGTGLLAGARRLEGRNRTY